MPNWLMHAVFISAAYVVWWLVPIVVVLTRRVTSAAAARRRVRGLVAGSVILLVLMVWAASSTPAGCTPNDCILHPGIIIVPSYGFAIIWMTVSAMASHLGTIGHRRGP